MARILFFMYTGHVRVTELTVCQVLAAAAMLQVQNVVDACCAFLERQLDPSNAIGIASFADKHSCKELKKKAEQFIEQNFTKVCNYAFDTHQHTNHFDLFTITDMPRGGIPATNCEATNLYDKKRRTERARRKRCIRRCGELGSVRL